MKRREEEKVCINKTQEIPAGNAEIPAERREREQTEAKFAHNPGEILAQHAVEVSNENSEPPQAKVVMETVSNMSEDEAEGEIPNEPATNTQTTECKVCDQNRKEIDRLLQENRELKSELKKRELNEEFLKDNTEKVKYYTGLPCFAVLISLFRNVQVFLPTNNKLTPFQMLLLTLMRLRLDLPIQHLCHLFNVTHKTLSSAFNDTIDVLHARLGPLVHWPERDCQQAIMPQQFINTFGKRVAIIIDCFEIRIERPSNLKARAQTYSHYKGTHTMKYLIGITPQGSISFISNGWGGRASDKHITEKSGLLNRLLPGDVVLADRGFDIKEDVGMICAEVKIPCFTKGLRQLDAKAIEDTRAIAHLRIHVERVIGCMRNKYKMLHTTIPVRLLIPREAITHDESIWRCSKFRKPTVDYEATLIDQKILVMVCCAANVSI
ncbi:hypothetical protein WMY93_008185 [Mugilogobius chulae]|uniref:DDE Tnp4 domain-containing protein n=1 Tax=Mugilogobius chulae TaxID=88201 RepID=A0AAW0PP65_9GOBI